MDYRLYLLTPAGRIEAVEIIRCDDDVEAIKVAGDRAARDGYVMELWHRARRISRCAKGGFVALGPPSDRCEARPG